MSNYAESDAQLQDWPEKSTNDVVTAMLTRLPQLCWLELNADWPNSIYYHPRLAVSFHLNIDFETGPPDPPCSDGGARALGVRELA